MPTSSSPTHPPSDSGSTETQETFDTLKRKYDQLIRKSRKKQRSMNNPTVEERARGIRKVASLYTNISTLAAVALAQEEGGESDAEEVASEEEQRRRKIERHRLYRSYLVVCQLIPDFRNKTIELHDDELLSYYHQLNTAANNARGDDVHRLKEVIIDWIGGAGSQQLPLSKQDRSGRWLHHDVTARLLCPINYNWDNPDVRQKFKAGDSKYDINRSFFHRCLYDNETGNPNNIESGFLKGPLLLKTFKHIFTSPSSVDVTVGDTQPAQKRRHLQPSQRMVANILGMNNQVTPRAIAYAAVQLIFALSEAQTWVQEHEGYQFSALYDFIIDFFEAPDLGPKAKERTKALLAWWNRRVFPIPSNPDSESMLGDHLSRELLSIQRARAETDV